MSARIMCWARGPRRDSDVPFCVRPQGHRGDHVGAESWGSPRWPAGATINGGAS